MRAPVRGRCRCFGGQNGWLDSSATQVVPHTPFHPGICPGSLAGFWSQEFPFLQP